MGYQKPKAPVFDGTALPATSRDQKARAIACPDTRRMSQGHPEDQRRTRAGPRMRQGEEGKPEAGEQGGMKKASPP